jgi:intracellular sulfur oxidation DsrE/DsrF family protein
MRDVMIGALFLALTGPIPAVSHAAEPQEAAVRHRVVMHVNTGDETLQRGVLNNIRNLYQAVGRDQLTLELVAHGPGLSLFMKKTTTLGPELAQLQADYGVALTACSNTMKGLHLTRGDLIDAVGDTVPAMVRLMERQEQGWAYIKP